MNVTSLRSIWWKGDILPPSSGGYSDNVTLLQAPVALVQSGGVKYPFGFLGSPTAPFNRVSPSDLRDPVSSFVSPGACKEQYSTVKSPLDRVEGSKTPEGGVHGHEGGFHGHEGGSMSMKGGVHGHEGGSMGMEGGVHGHEGGGPWALREGVHGHGRGVHVLYAVPVYPRQQCQAQTMRLRPQSTVLRVFFSARVRTCTHTVYRCREVCLGRSQQYCTVCPAGRSV